MVEQRCCPRCGAAVSGTAPEGLCPECLFRQAIEGPGVSPPQAEAARSPFPVFIPPTPAELAPHFPQLEILELIGQGGMGAVYKARQAKLDRLVAVKVLPPEVARDPTFAERFSREARSLARLNHPHIVTIFDFGESEGLYYFTMEYVDGKNLRELLQAGALTPSQALQVIPQVCEALQYAHDEGIVHRDIKPENILLDRKGRVKIADFGLAKIVGLSPTYLTLTGSQQVMGTMYYMAPEQMTRSHPIDHRADLYSLGVVFYEMLTGELPLGRFAPPSHKARVDPRLDAIVLRALVREPEARYQDAAELKKDVESVTSGPQAPAQVLVGNIQDHWPIVRFVVPNLSWYGTEARGEVYRDSEALIVEFRVDWFSETETKVVRIPFTEITYLYCQSDSLPELSDLPKKKREKLERKRKTEIVIKAARPGVIDQLPAGEFGRGRLQVDWRDWQAARDLVNSVVRPSRAEAAIPTPEPADRPQPPADPERVRQRVKAAAIGLLVAAAISFCWILSLETGAGAAQLPSDGVSVKPIRFREFWAALGATALFVTGAVQMLRLRSYPLAVAAALVAVVPWPLFFTHLPFMLWGFAWLPFGLWALAVLCQPDVQALFRTGPPSVPHGLPGVEPPLQRVVRPIRSLARSVARYFVSGLSGRADLPPSSPGSAGAANSGGPVGRDQPLPQTSDYVSSSVNGGNAGAPSGGDK